MLVCFLSICSFGGVVWEFVNWGGERELGFKILCFDLCVDWREVVVVF